MAIKRSGFQAHQTHAVAVRARPIGSAEVADLKRAMAAIAPAWSVELQGGDEATLVLVPKTGDDAVGPSFMISQEDGGFRIEQLHWDVLTEVGRFASMQEVAAAINARLALGAEAGASSSVTLH